MRVLSHGFILVLLLFGSTSLATAESSIDESAKAFGSHAFGRGMRLSPDGHRVSMLIQHSTDIPFAIVVDLRTGKNGVILASEKKKGLDIRWCNWKNESRLLCSFYGLQKFRWKNVAVSRLVAVNDDATDVDVLTQRQQRDEFAFSQDEIVDWLPGDNSQILLEIREKNGQGVSSVDIYKNRMKRRESPRDGIWHWMSNGRGELVLRRHMSDRAYKWQYRQPGARTWNLLHTTKPSDLLDDAFSPAGFGEDPTKLLAWDTHEGRTALWSVDLANDLKRELVYAHPKADLSGLSYLGRYRRLVGVGYSTEKPQIEYFDQRVREIVERIEVRVPDELVRIAGESWDRRYYLVFATSDTNAGVYYRFDTRSDKLEKILDTYPQLKDFSLGKVTAIEYPSDDGVIVPAYMTIPADGATGPLPTILMPHGGPYSRDEWGFDWLAQFLANRGYVVLQSNYRGSAGYGHEWAGDGAFKGWKRAMVDLEYGLRHLVAEGVTDPTRVCTVGWSYGGYAALMSAAEYPERHRCVVSIAGVTDLQQLLNEAQSDARVYVGRGDKVIRGLIGKDSAVIKDGSPQQRADEIEAPVLLFHGDIDQNVPVLHSQKMKKALPKKRVEYIEYEGDDHQLRRQENRIDMLRRIGKFLEVNLTPENSPEI